MSGRLPAWPGDVPAGISPLAPALILPRLSPEIPEALAISQANRAIAELAEALRQVGMLRPEDWCGELGDTVEGGLRRWYFSEMGAGRLRHVRLELLYTDDLNADQGEGYYTLNLTDAVWLNEHGRKPGRGEAAPRVGAFALGCGDPEYGDEFHGESVFVGEGVRRLNELAAGAGYSVFGLVGNALASTVGAATPEWGVRCLDFVGGIWGGAWDEVSDDEDEEPANGYYFGSARYSQAQIERKEKRDKRRFRSAYPRGVWTAKWRPELVRRALRLTADPQLCELLEEALALGALVEPHEDECLNEWGAFQIHGEEMAAPVLLRWDENDLLARLYDNYLHQLNENAGWTPVIFLRGWQADYPASIRRCLQGLKLAVEIVVRADRILQALHSMHVPRERARVRVG